MPLDICMREMHLGHVAVELADEQLVAGQRLGRPPLVVGVDLADQQPAGGFNMLRLIPSSIRHWLAALECSVAPVRQVQTAGLPLPVALQPASIELMKYVQLQCLT